MIDAPLPDADARWQQWKERGEAHDQASAKRMRFAMFAVAFAIMVWGVTRLS